jgi:hypothetical protein
MTCEVKESINLHLNKVTEAALRILTIAALDMGIQTQYHTASKKECLWSKSAMVR